MDQFIYFLISSAITVLMALIMIFLYDFFEKIFSKNPIKEIAQTPLQIKKTNIITPRVTNFRFSVELNGIKQVSHLTEQTFVELMKNYFIGIEYLLELWKQHPFHITINDDLHANYGRPEDAIGFIISGNISAIYVKVVASKKHATGILIHEIAHDRAFREARSKNIKIQNHGKEFKYHLKKLFEPLLADETHYTNYQAISRHLRYHACKHSPLLAICE